MAYEVEFSPTAKKNLDLLDKQIVIRVLKKLKEIKENPARYVKRLVDSELLTLRVGDYRVLLLVIDNKLKIVNVGHRSKIYEM